MVLRFLSCSQLLLSAGILALNCYFVSAIEPFLPFFAWIAAAFIGFSFLGNFADAIVLVRTLETKSRALKAFGLVFSLIDLTVCHFLDPGRDITQDINSFRLGLGFFQSLPLLVLQAYSLSTVATLPTLLAIFFNASSLALLLIQEVSCWVLRPRSSEQRRDKSTLTDPLLASELDSPTELALNPAPPPPKYFAPLCWISFPIVLVSFLPHLCTLVGIPFSLACLRRFFIAKAQVNDGSSAIRRDLGPMEQRGYFLVPLNLVSLSFVLFLLLPGISAIGLVLVAYNKIQFQFTRRKSGTFRHFRASIQALVASLSFCYFPFLRELPAVRVETLSSQEDLPWWKTALAVCLFLVAEFLAGLDIVTDFQFSFQLYALSQDSLLTGKETLTYWTVVSFATSAVGLALDLIKTLLFVVPIARRPSRKALLEGIIAESVFGKPDASSWKGRVLKILHAAAVDLVQLLVVTSTVSFVGLVNPLWSLKLAVSLVSSSFHLSKVVVEFVFGKKVMRGVKLGLQIVYFFLIGSALATAVGLTINNTFCDLNRTVRDADILGQLGLCAEIRGIVNITGNVQPMSQTLQVTSLLTPLTVEGNTGAVNLNFASLEGIPSKITFSENTGSVTLSFSSLNSVNPNGSLAVEDNAGNFWLDLPVLYEIYGGGELRVVNTSDPGTFSLPSLASVDGDLTLESTAFQDIVLSLLINVKGSLTISRASVETLSFPSLSNVFGLVSLLDNSHLVSVTLPSLVTVNGLLQISNSSALVDFALPKIMDAPLSLVVSNNPALRSVFLGGVTGFDGVVTIEGNPQLTTIATNQLQGMSLNSDLIISSCPSLVSLDFRTLDCSQMFSVKLLNNTNLSTVYLTPQTSFPLAACLSMITSENNSPQLRFIDCSVPSNCNLGER